MHIMLVPDEIDFGIAHEIVNDDHAACRIGYHRLRWMQYRDASGSQRRSTLLRATATHHIHQEEVLDAGIIGRSERLLLLLQRHRVPVV